MVVHGFFAYKVAFCHFISIDEKIGQSVFLQAASIFIFLIVSIAFGVVQTNVKANCIIEMMVGKQLYVMLYIVIGLVVVVVGFAVLVSVHITATVVTSSILLHLLLACVVPCMISLFCTGIAYETYGGFVAVVCALHVV